jgi:hypothetical protein
MMVHSKKKTQGIILCTECFDLDEVKLQQEVLVDKFKLDCNIFAVGTGHRIRILKKSLPVVFFKKFFLKMYLRGFLKKVQALLKDIMPPMMMHKIGLPSHFFDSTIKETLIENSKKQD